jgi:hypothetical protein
MYVHRSRRIWTNPTSFIEHTPIQTTTGDGDKDIQWDVIVYTIFGYTMRCHCIYSIGHACIRMICEMYTQTTCSDMTHMCTPTDDDILVRLTEIIIIILYYKRGRSTKNSDGHGKIIFRTTESHNTAWHCRLIALNIEKLYNFNGNKARIWYWSRAHMDEHKESQVITPPSPDGT